MQKQEVERIIMESNDTIVFQPLILENSTPDHVHWPLACEARQADP